MKQYRGPIGEYLVKPETPLGVAALPELGIAALKAAEEKRLVAYTAAPNEQFERKKYTSRWVLARIGIKNEAGINLTGGEVGR